MNMSLNTSENYNPLQRLICDEALNPMMSKLLSEGLEELGQI